MRNNLRYRLRLEAIQPVKEIHKHSQCILLSRLHQNAKICLSHVHIWLIFEFEVFLLERNGAINAEPDGTLETSRDSIFTNVVPKGPPHIGEHEANVFGQGLGEDGRQDGQCVVYVDMAARNSAIGEDENSSDRVSKVLDLSSPLVELVLLKSASVS